MKKEYMVEDIVNILTKINKQTIQSYIKDSGGGGAIYMRRGMGLGRSPSPKYYFGNKHISTEKVLSVIELVKKFPNDFVWLKHQAFISNFDDCKVRDIYILMYVDMIVPGKIEKPKMLISFSPAHFDTKDATKLKNQLEKFVESKENKDRCDLFQVKPLDCKSPSIFDIFHERQASID